jgi:hypothetical protein
VCLGEGIVRLERFQAKWIPVRVKKTRQIKNLELRSDSIGTEKALDEIVDRIVPHHVNSSPTSAQRNLDQTSPLPFSIASTSAPLGTVARAHPRKKLDGNGKFGKVKYQQSRTLMWYRVREKVLFFAKTALHGGSHARWLPNELRQ